MEYHGTGYFTSDSHARWHIPTMEPAELYKKFDQEFFYNFQKHSTDIELEELGRRYHQCLDKNERVLNDILEGRKHPDDLRDDVKQELDSLAGAEAKFAKELPLNIKGEHFDSETGFNELEGKLRGLVEGRAHLVRLIKPSEYDRNYWFYSQGDNPAQNVFCSEFGLDLIEFLKGVRTVNRTKLANLRKALAFQKREIYQFWTLGPYLHHRLMELGCSWNASIMTILKIAGKRFAQEAKSFAGTAKFQLGYDERMPTHLLARMEAMRDIILLQQGDYTEKYGIVVPDCLT